MKIIRAVIKNCNRINLHGITEVDYTPEKKLQIILGTNGSGKSSLLNELSLIPTNRSDYSEGGYKLIDISHKNKIYTLKSFYDNGAYSFSVDGEELNNGNTRTAQVDLVQEHFGITPQIQELMLGHSKFTTMSISERKYWFSTISDSDHTYGLKVYKDLVTRLRDVKGSIKTLESRLSTETNKLLSDVDYSNLIQLRNDMNNELDYLMINKVDIPKTKTEILEELNIVRTKISRLQSRLGSIPTIDICDMRDIDIERSVLEEKLRSIKEQISSIQSTNIEYQDSLVEINESVNHDILNDSKILLTDELKLIRNSIPDYIKIDFEVFRNLWTPIGNILDEYMVELVDISREVSVGMATEDVNKKRGLIESKNKELSSLLRKKENEQDVFNKLKGTDSKCSNCGTLLSESLCVSTDDNSNITIEKEINDNNDQLEHLNDSLDLLKRRSMLISLATNLVSSNNELNALDDVVEPFSDLLNNIDMARVVIHELNESIPYIEKYIKVKTKLDDVVKTLSETSVDNSRKVGEIKGIIKNNNKKLDGLFSVEDELDTKLKTIIKKSEDVIKIKDINDNIKTLETGTLSVLENMYSSYLKNVDTNKRIVTIRTTITELEEKINNNDSVISIVTSMTDQLVSLKKSKDVVEVMSKGLSPTGGLIGESIYYSMKNILESMNGIISRIWSYPLVIQPCLVSGDSIDLTYRFPVQIDNKDGIVTDVSKTSSSMQEIIDLAFRIVVITKLGLTPYPLYLDEFGRSFDPVHRETAYRIIEDELLPSTEISQILIVSHFIENYGSMTKGDVNVLGDTNIELPNHDSYNTMLKIS